MDQAVRIPFTSAALRYREKIFTSAAITLGTSAQDASPPGGAIKSYGYLRRLLLKVVGTGGGGGNFQPDAPFNFFSAITVTQPNGEEMFGGPTFTGLHGVVAADHAGRFLNDSPDTMPSFVGTSPNFTLVLPITFEIDPEHGVGALPNMDFSAPWKLGLTVNTSAAVFLTAPTTAATYTVGIFMDCWTVPSPRNALNPNLEQEVAPPLLGTLNKWTVQQYSITAGSLQNVLLSRKGNAIRNLCMIARGAANARVAVSNFPNPFTLKWDGTVIRANDDPALVIDDEYQTRGGIAMTTPFTPRTGVMTFQMSDMSGIDAQAVAEGYGLGAFWGTVQSSTLEIGGTWGASITVLEVLTNDVQFVDLSGNPYAFSAGTYVQQPAQPSARP